MTNHNLVIRFSFLEAGRKLSANYKPLSGNTTCTGTIISNNEIVVSHMRVPSLLNVDELKGGRGTLCFKDPTLCAELIKRVNDELVNSNIVDICIEDSDNIIYNSENNNKSLTIFNPTVEVIETNIPVISKTILSAPNSETVPFDYESFLAFRRENNVSDLTQVRAAKSQINVNKTVI